MQLLDSTQTSLKARVSRQLMDVLEDIAHKVKVHSDFSIHHPDYKPLELPAEVVERFQKIPGEIQQKYLSLQLRSFLYGIYYNGSLRSTVASDGEEKGLPLDVENNTVLGVDLEFYQQLHESNCGEGYFDSGWSVLKEESDGSLAVTKKGLRLHIERNQHLQVSEQTAAVGDSISIRMPKNLVQNGFYMAVSNLGFSRPENTSSQQMVRIYFNLTPAGAVVIMESLTQRLNKMTIPFNFKVLYNPKEYKRYDAGVLYFERKNYEIVREVLQIVYGETRPHFHPEIPLFTKQLAPGLSLAEEPDKKFAELESFGMNRCQIIANGLLKAWQQENDSLEQKMQVIIREFYHFGIDLQHVYLNANSEDIYRLIA